MIRIAINGYGRIGRGVHRLALESDELQVVAINSRAGADSHAYLLRHDSLYGKCDADIEIVDGGMKINGEMVNVYQIADPAQLDWSGIDLVIESTGKFTTMEHAKRHLDAGAKKVLITAPCKEMEIPNIVMGVNESSYSSDDFHVVSNASCTTNCLAPVLKVLSDEFGVKKSFVTTIHAYTYTQNLLDNSNPEDFRRSRATMESIIPTTTGAMKAISRILPELTGKVDGMAFRVPVPTVSCIDLTAQLEKKVTANEINEMFTSYSKDKMKGILGVSDEELVSVDFRGDERSSIVDLPSTKVLDDDFIQVVSWYDNEWGYISRVMDLIKWFTK